MARAVIPVTTSTNKGALLVAEQNGDAVNFHQLANSGREKLHVRNSGAVSRTVTFKFAKQVQGQAVTDQTKAIPAGETWVFGPFPTEDYGTTMLINVDNAELKLRAVA